MTYYVMGVGGGVENPLSPHAKNIFLMKSGRKKRENVCIAPWREMFTFFTLLILVKLFKSIGVGIIYIGQWGGGGANAGGG